MAEEKAKAPAKRTSSRSRSGGKVYVAVETAHVELSPGNEVIVRAGRTRVREGDALYKSNPHLFDVDDERDFVENTAKPAASSRG